MKLLAALVAFLALASAASAATRPFTASESRWVAYASLYWGVPPSCGEAAWYVEDGLVFQNHGGYAAPAECVAVIDSWVVVNLPRRACAVVLHEYGHLLGVGHEDPRMSRPCKRRLFWSGNRGVHE